MKKLSLLCVFILILSLMVSCNNGGADNAVSNPSKTVKVSLHMSSADSSAQKTLAIDTGNSNIAYYKYKATPQWTSVDWGTVKGTQTDWTEVNQGDTIWFTQGLWHIEVQAYADGVSDPIATGELDCYISSQTSSLEIPITRVEGQGKIAISITVPELSAGGGALTLEYGVFGGATQVFSGGFTKNVANHIITYTATIENVQSGSYIFKFMFGDSNVDFRYGETYVAEVFANMTTTVTGDLAVGKLVQAGKTSTVYGAKDAAVTFVCLNDADTFAWYVNGELQQNTDRRFFIFTPTAYDTYTIECKLNDSASAGDIGTVTLDVRNPITLYLHFKSGSGTDEDPYREEILQHHTYTNLINKNALSHYLTSMHVQNWYTAEENGTGGGGSIYNSTANFTADTHLYAHRNYYTVTFNKNTNSRYVTVNPGSVGRYHGTALGMLPSLGISSTSFEEIFDGWYTSTSYQTKVDESTNITGNVTYYIKWIDKDLGPTSNNKYNVIFAVYDHSDGYFHWYTNTQSVQGTSIMQVTAGQKIRESDISNLRLLMPNGYTQVNGWYRNREYDADDNALLSGKWDFDNDVVNSHMWLLANPVNNSDQRTITFNTHGGSTVNSMTVYRFTTVAAPAEPTKQNQKFAGWFKDEQYTQPWHFDTDYVYDNMTLHAMWLDPNAKDYLEVTSETSDVSIDIGITPDDNTRVVIEFEFDGDRAVTLAGTSSPIWGIRTEYASKMFAGVYGSEIRASEVSYTDRIKHVLEFSAASGFKVDGRAYEKPSSSGLSAGSNIFIFKAPGDTYAAVGKCYSVQVYSGATLVRYLVPYYRPDDGIYGFYDTVTQNFYHSSGSDPVIGGDD